MYRLFVLLFTVLLMSVSLYSEEYEPIQTVPGNVIIKFKNNISIPSHINDEINSNSNSKAFGLGNVDELLEEFQIKDIKQKFPHHSTSEFQAQMRDEYNNEINTLENLYLIRFGNEVPTGVLINRLERLPEIQYAEPVYIHSTSVKDIELQDLLPEPNDEKYPNMTHLTQISAPEAWAIAKGEDGAEVIVGIGDSGVEWHHPDLFDNLWENLGEDANNNGTVLQFNEDTQKWEFDSGDINGIDDDDNGYVDDILGWNFSYWTDGTPQNNVDVAVNNTHGTHVAGLAAGVTNNEIGIASASWNVKFLATKHGNNNNPRYIYNGYDGIVYLAENGADVINLSWGGGGFSYYAQEIIDYANSLGSIILAAAGNYNTSNPHFPSAYSGIISVASVASNDVKAYYSTYGPTVDIAAPGGDAYVDGGLWSTVPGYNYAKYQGTSMASPVAAGVFALIKSHFPEMSKEEIIAQVLGTTDYIYDLNPNYTNMLGTGRINAYNALTQEPNIQEGLILSILKQTFSIYDADNDYYYPSDNGFVGTQGYLEFVIKNSNNFYGQEFLEIHIDTDYDGLNFDNTVFVESIGSDDNITLTVPYSIDENSNSGFANININFIDPDNDIIYGENFHTTVFINGGGMLVWEPVANGQDMSGMFIKDYYENLGYKVFYTNEVLPSLEGFDAVFYCYGSTSSPNYSLYYAKQYQMLAPLTNYAYLYGDEAKIFFETIDFLTHHNPYLLGGTLDLAFLGLTDVSYIPDESVLLNNIYGVDNTFLEDLFFAGSSQNNSYEMDLLTPDPAYGNSVLEVEDFGTVAVAAVNALGNKLFTTTKSISMLNDEDCRSSRRNLMRRLNTFFELYNPVEFKIGDVVTCQGAPTGLGIDDDDCELDDTYVNIVNGGSGYFSVEWSPKLGIDDGFKGNPIELNPSINRVYKVTVTDLLLEETYTKDVLLEVNKGANVKLPLFVMHPMATPINLNDRIISISGGTAPYEEYIWTDQAGNSVDPENEIPNPGIQRYYLTVLDANGCPSKSARMIVYVSAFKQFNEDDVVAGENGSLLMTSYPNPANDVINLVSVFEYQVNATVSIIDINGKEVYSQNKNSVSEIQETININNLSSGTYFIIVNSGDDKVMKKFIKE